MSQMTKETRKLLNHEKLTAKRVLGKLHGQAWLSQIAMIKDEETRIRVANIVWWDFFGDKTVGKRWAEFDGYLEAFKPINCDVKLMEDTLACSMDADSRAQMTALYTKRMDGITLNVRMGLEKVGYTHAMAKARMGKTAAEKMAERMYRNKRVKMCNGRKGTK